MSLCWVSWCQIDPGESIEIFTEIDIVKTGDKYDGSIIKNIFFEHPSLLKEGSKDTKGCIHNILLSS